MAVTIANWFDADRRSCRAGETMTIGNIVKMSGDANGERFAMKLSNGDAAKLTHGDYAIIYKVSADAAYVEETTAPEGLTGSRLVTIASGDQVVEVRPGALIEYAAADLHDSLNPDEGGDTPAVGDHLSIVDSLPCKESESSAIDSPQVLKVYMVHGTSIIVELL
jgi:hypothetical protein